MCRSSRLRFSLVLSKISALMIFHNLVPLLLRDTDRSAGSVLPREDKAQLRTPSLGFYSALSREVRLEMASEQHLRDLGS
jgi:hypothetical protein